MPTVKTSKVDPSTRKTLKALGTNMAPLAPLRTENPRIREMRTLDFCQALGRKGARLLELERQVDRIN